MVNALKEVESNLGKTQKSLQDVNRLLKLDPTNTELLSQKHKLLKNAIEDTETKLKALKEADVQAKQQLDSGDLGQDKYDALQREIIETEEKLKNLKNTAGSGSAELAKISAETEQFSNKTGELANKLAPVSAAVTAVGAASVKLASDFEAGMSEVLAISGATEEEFQLLTDKAIEMGAKTKFSAGESADAFKYMAMAGWDTEEMLNSIAGVMDLAAAAGEDLGTTSDIVTDAMTAFGMAADGTSKVLKDGLSVEVSNATRFADVLAMASSKSNTSVSLMGETFKYVAPVAGALGYSVEDVSVAIGLMANSGIKASQAGTSLRTLMTNMANPTDTMSVAMTKLGISLDDGEGNMLSFKEVMMQLREGFGELAISEEEFNTALRDLDASFESGAISEKQYEEAFGRLVDQAYGAEGALKAQYAAMLAGKTGMSGLLAIVNATDEEFESLTNDIYNANGATSEMAATMMDNTAGAFEQLGGALESAAIVIGDRLSPYIRQLAEFVTKLVEKFSNMSDQQLDLVVKVGAFVAALAPLLKIVSSVAGGISTLSGVLSKASGVGDVMTKAFTGLKTAFSALFTLIQAHPVIAVITGIVAAIVTLYNKCDWFREGVNNIVKKVWDYFKNLGQNLSTTFENIKSKVNQMVSNVTNYFQNLLNKAKSIFENIKSAITTKVNNMKSSVTTGFQNMVDKIKSTVSKVTNAVKNGFNGAVNFLKSLKSKAVGWGRDFMQGMINGIKEKITRIVSTVKGVAEKIAQYLHFSRPDKGPLHYYEEWMPDFMKGLRDGILSNSYLVENAMKQLNEKMASLNPVLNANYMSGDQQIQLVANVIAQFGGKNFESYMTDAVIKRINSKMASEKKVKGA